MVKVKGYYLNANSRYKSSIDPNGPAMTYLSSKHRDIFSFNSMKIGMLLILSESIDRLVFLEKEKGNFTNYGHIFYSRESDRPVDMIAYGKEALRQQAIVSLISNWESYFFSVARDFFGDRNFIEYQMRNNRVKFVRHLKQFNLYQEYLLYENKQELDNSKNFGLILLNQKRELNFQDPTFLNKFFNNFFDINLIQYSRNIDPNFWGEICKITEARHIIVHESIGKIMDGKTFRNECADGEARVTDIYRSERISKILMDMNKLIVRLEMMLFSNFEVV